MKFSDWDYIFQNGKIDVIPNIPIETPMLFYKYYSITDYNIEAIKTSKLYFSHPLVFNDLFESSIQMLELDKLSQKKLISLYDRHKEIVWPHQPMDYRAIKNFVETRNGQSLADFLRTTLTFYWNIIFIKTGVLSLASIDNNILLWSYYTNNSGEAIEFQNLPIDKKETFGPYPINYTDNYETMHPKTTELDKERLLYLTNVKSLNWKHENEWRLLLRRDNLSIPNYRSETLLNTNRLVSYPKSNVKSVILGFKFFKGFIPYEIDKRTFRYTFDALDKTESLNLKTQLLNYLVDNNVPIKQVQTNEDNTFRIESANVNVEIIERDRVYIVTRSRENKRANLRLSSN